jgi:hypothetical protein
LKHTSEKLEGGKQVHALFNVAVLRLQMMDEDGKQHYDQNRFLLLYFPQSSENELSHQVQPRCHDSPHE